MSFDANCLAYAVKEKSLLSNVSLSLAPGEMKAIIGPNGAGKSTLLKLMSGDISPFKGQITLDKLSLNKLSAKQQASKRAVVAQHTEMYFPFKVHEIVTMGWLSAAESVITKHEVASQAMREMGIYQLANQAYDKLSGGEKQRVQLARALMQLWRPDENQARYLLLDEPTSSLDLFHQQQLMKCLRGLLADGVGILIVLHDLNLAAQYADKLILMNQGRLMANDTPREVLVPDLLHDVYGLNLKVEHKQQSNQTIVYAETSAVMGVMTH